MTRWEELGRSLRAIASEADAMEMEGDFAAVARQRLQAHPNDVTPLARGRADAASALQTYAGQLEQAKRESQAALREGVQAKRNRDVAERNLKQVRAQMRAMERTTYYGPAYYAAVQRYNMLVAQEMQCINAWERAEAQRMAAQQKALQAGERARQQESLASQKVSAATQAIAAPRSRSDYDLAG